VPFGLGQAKPQHFRDMVGIAWRNRDNLSYAWKVLSRGVCDGCALGVAGFHDWTIEGVHLCMTRLNLLRLNTMPELDVKLLEDVARLKSLDNAQLRELGRLPYPMLRERSAKGFRRISWEDAYRRIANRIRATTPKRWAMFVTSRGVTNEVYYMAQKAARFLGTNNVDNAARICHSPSTAAMKYALGVAASTCSYKDWYGTDLIIFFGANPANDQPVTTKYLHEAKALGTKIVMVNPYREPGMERYWVPSNLKSAVFGTDLADYWFPVSTGGDIAFLGGVLKILIENNWVDENFTRNHTGGFNELKSAIDRWPMEILETQSGLNREAMPRICRTDSRREDGCARLEHGHYTTRFRWRRGLNDSESRSAARLGGARQVRADAHSRPLLRAGRRGMGAYATAFPGGKPINAENAVALSQHYGFPVPDWTGLTATEMVEACARGRSGFVLLSGRKFFAHIARAGICPRRAGQCSDAGASRHHSHRPDVHRGEGRSDPAPSQNALRAGRRRH
jgi:predicted molibdopterin-dependent oxidoreductase YjgC